MLVICETHPVQYHAPVYQELRNLRVPFHVVYGSNFSVTGYHDVEFRANFAWDTDLLSGYDCSFVKTVEAGGAQKYEESNPYGLKERVRSFASVAVMALGYSSPFDRGAIRLAKELNMHLMLRTEASDVALRRGSVKALLRDVWLRRLYRRSAAFLYVGQNAYRHYRRLRAPEEKLFFSPYCVSTAAFQCDEFSRKSLRIKMREMLGIPHESLVLLFCGKLSSRKGVEQLLTAVKSFPKALRERTVVLYLGDGVLRSSLEQAAQQDPRVCIQITGFKNQSELSPYYHAADLAVLPSVTSETWGLVVNEALHHGLRCVVSDRVGCASDLIMGGQTGEVVPAADVDALGVALKQNLAKPSTPESREVCRKHVAKYSVASAAEGIAKAYGYCRRLGGGRR